MLSRKALGTAFVIALMSTTIPAAQATLFPGFPIDSDRQAASIEELVDNPFSFIRNVPFQMAVQAGTAVESPEKTKFCDEFNTHGCNLDSKADLAISSVLPVCETVIENCVDKLQIQKADGTVIEAKFLRYFKGKTFVTPAELGMPGGSRPSLWQAVGAPNSSGTELYVVNAKLIWTYKSGSTDFQSFNASVYPVKENPNSKYKDSGIYIGPAFKGEYASVTETGEILYDGSCVATELGNCAQRAEFAPGTRDTLGMKVSNKMTGWLHGRIAKPDITVKPINSNLNSLIVSADVVDVPMMYAAFKDRKSTRLNSSH